MLSITIVKADYSDGTESGGGSNNAGKGCSGTDSCWISTYYGARVHLYSFDMVIVGLRGVEQHETLHFAYANRISARPCTFAA